MGSTDDSAILATATFSTEGLVENQQFESWREQIGARFGMAEVSRAATGPFRARIETVSLSTLALSEISADALTFERTRKQIGHRDSDQFTIGLLLEGAAVVEQDERSARLEPGDMVLCDGRRPYRLHFDEPFRQLVFHCERAELEVRIPDVDRRTAQRIPGQAALHSATAAYVATIAKQQRGLSSVDCTIARHALDLLSFTLTDVSARTPASQALLVRIHAYIEKNLADPELDPAMIAGHHRISRRYLYRLFDESGDTVAAFIRRRRLSRCQALLADELSNGRSISEIAFAWGFNDASSFGRAFREEFGMTPRDYRRSARRQSTQGLTKSVKRR